MNILIFILILFVLVVAHEAGHFFSAKSFGIRVDEFGFGWPPKVFGIKKGETEYTFNLLPIGGFVKIFGEDPNDENTRGPDAMRSFVNKPKSQQAIVLLAGIAANSFVAWLLFSIALMSGLPMSAGNEPKGMYLTDVHLVVVNVAKDSPAYEEGLKSQDRIVYARTMDDSLDAISPEGLQNFVAKHPTDVLEIGYVRGDKDVRDQKNISSVSIVPSIYDSSLSKPGIGIAMDEVGYVKLPFVQALIEGMKINIQVTKSTAIGLYDLIANAFKGEGDLSSVTGPVGMVGIVGDAYKFGFAYLLSFAALISVNLAIINLIPFPALDGGRVLFLIIEKIKGSRINPKITNTANIVGFVILILLMLFVTYRDILKLI